MATEKDLVLIYFEQKPTVFARIEEILPDAKPDWYHVKLLLLQLPPQLVTWILRDVYINGETFTMNGKAMRLEKVDVPTQPSSMDTEPPARDDPEPKKARVIAFSGSRKNKAR